MSCSDVEEQFDRLSIMYEPRTKPNPENVYNVCEFLAHIFVFVFIYTLGLFQLFEGALEDMSEIQMYKSMSLMVGAFKYLEWKNQINSMNLTVYKTYLFWC